MQMSGLRLIGAVEYTVTLLTAKFYEESHEVWSPSVWPLEGAGGKDGVVSAELIWTVRIPGWWKVAYVTAAFPDRGTTIKPRQPRCELGGPVSVGSKTVLDRDTRGLEVLFSWARVSEMAS